MESKLKKGDKLYYIVSSIKQIDKFYDIVYSEIIDIKINEFDKEERYLIKHNGKDLYLSCNGFKGENLIARFMISEDESNNVDYKIVSFNAYTTKEDAIDEYRNLLTSYINAICRKLIVANNNISNMRFYEIGAWKIESDCEYYNRLKIKDEIGTDKCCKCE